MKIMHLMIVVVTFNVGHKYVDLSVCEIFQASCVQGVEGKLFSPEKLMIESIKKVFF